MLEPGTDLPVFEEQSEVLGLVFFWKNCFVRVCYLFFFLTRASNTIVLYLGRKVDNNSGYGIIVKEKQ